VCLLFAVVVGRLAQLQAVGGNRYVALGESQRVRLVTLPGQRGSVFDRNGRDLALSIEQSTVVADPHLVGDSVVTAAKLAPLLGVDPAVLEPKLRTSSSFVYLARQVPDDVADKVKKPNLAGISLIQEPKRFNPSGDLARSVLGAVNVDDVGSAGLELQYDKLLTGDPGQLVVEQDPNGRTIPAGEHQLKPASRGEDLILTIDQALQYETEQALARQIDAMGAKGGIAVVSDPQTGELLAIANLEKPDDGGPVRVSGNNKALTTVFEPGSANKLITLSAALQEGTATPQTLLDVPDHLQVSDHLFTDHDPHPTKQWTPTDIMTTSSNIGTIMLAQQLGKDRLEDYMKRFGFGSRTGLGFPNESAGLLLPTDKWSGTSIGSIPIGQGIAVTAVQMLAAYNVIANEGVYVAPKLLKATVDGAGVEHATPAAERHRVVSATTAREVRDMMVEVVRMGTGKAAAIDGYDVAGKTGTARKPQPNGTYRDAAGNYHYVATFAGFVPAQDPKLSVIVVIDEPSASIFASGVSAPVFAQVASYGLRQFRVPPPAEALTLSVPAATTSERDVPATPVTTTTIPATGGSTTSTTAGKGSNPSTSTTVHH
jgi:cell division protein FtsI (penicillin-binding protein 3)